MIVRATGAENICPVCKFDLRLRFGVQRINQARHICNESGAVTLSCKMADAKSMVRPQPHRSFPHHTAMAAPERDSALRSTGANRAATKIFAASPGRNGTTQSNRDSTNPVCVITMYQAVPNR